jgi:hypothetical protein
VSEYALWQKRFWEHTFRDDGDFERCADYIHFNPVKHRLVSSPAAWPFSSLHRYARAGVLHRDWGGGGFADSVDFGERRVETDPDFAEPVITARALLRSSGARIRATRWLHPGYRRPSVIQCYGEE